MVVDASLVRLLRQSTQIESLGLRKLAGRLTRSFLGENTLHRVHDVARTVCCFDIGLPLVVCDYSDNLSDLDFGRLF